MPLSAQGRLIQFGCFLMAVLDFGRGAFGVLSALACITLWAVVWVGPWFRMAAEDASEREERR